MIFNNFLTSSQLLTALKAANWKTGFDSLRLSQWLMNVNQGFPNDTRLCFFKQSQNLPSILTSFVIVFIFKSVIYIDIIVILISAMYVTKIAMTCSKTM